MFENYVGKWKKQKAVPVDDANNAGADDQEATLQKHPRQTGTFPGKRVGTANTVGGVMRESHDSMNFTALCRKTGNAPKQRQWRRNYRNLAAVSTVETLEGIRKENRAITMWGLQ